MQSDIAMEQLEFFDIPSPCRGICEVNSRGLCRGCLRNREERFQWQTFSDTRKREVLRLCNQRRHKLIQEILAARALAATGQGADSQADEDDNEPRLPGT
ncbi:DUF1289 domain-containing protein [Advenella mimigardefordensis]|uniref:DUF1289 domain-containing protein n=1 Tax=Advenella mimigardefordensis TaxID=302406 RepID=UPI001FE1A721|nr:DUF1289 domain-containing protein [Advenella mimigardefordensis]